MHLKGDQSRDNGKRPGFGNRIQVRVLLWSLGIGLVPLLLFGIMTVGTSEEHLRQMAVSTLRYNADTKAGQIETYARERLRDSRLISGMPGVRVMFGDFTEVFNSGAGVDSEAYRAVIKQRYPVIRQFADLDNYDDFLLISTNAQVVLSLKETSLVGSELNSGPLVNSPLAQAFRNALAQQQPVISRFGLMPENNEPQLWVAAPSYIMERLVGVVALQLQHHQLTDLVKDYSGMGDTGDVVLGMRDGDEVVVLAPPRFDSMAPFTRRVKLGSPTTQHIQEAVQGKEGFSVMLDYRNKPTLGVRRYLPLLELGLVVKVDEDEAFASVKKLREAVGIAGVFAILLVLLGSVAVSRWFISPIVDLTRTTQLIAAGEWDRRAEVNGHAEVAQLAFTLNHMTDSLQRTAAALKHSRDELERKVEERTVELREKQNRLNLALEAANAGFWTWNPVTNESVWGKRCREMFGVPPDVPMTHEKFLEALHPADRERANLRVREALETHNPYDDEFRALLPDGSIRWIDVLGQTVYDAEGTPTLMTGLVVDITNTKLNEEARQRSEKWLTTAIQNAPFPMVIHAEDGQILLLSDAWVELTGYTREELISIPEWTERAYGNRTGREAAEIQALYEKEGRVEEGEFAIRTREGRTLYWEFSSSALPPLGDGRRVVLSMAMDQTSRRENEIALKRYAEELERSNRELDQFAYIASHDLKAPLRAIDNLAKWIEEDSKEKLSEQSTNDMTLLRQRVKRMEGLLDSLLQYSRIGRVHESPTNVDTHELVEHLIDLQAAPAMNIEIEGHLPVVQGPRGALNRIFGNLIANAVKHHDRPEGRIVIRHRETPKYHEFDVEDDGPGIPDKFHKKVFEMFQTLKPRDEMEGSGIGLAVVLKTLQTHGGAIYIGHGTPRGTKMVFTWPKSPAKV